MNIVFPPEVLALFEAAGVDTVGFLACAAGDMHPDGSFGAAWLAFDAQGLYIALGRSAAQKYTLEQLQSVPLEDIERLRVESYVATGRLVMTERGEDVPLLRFSLGLRGPMGGFCEAFNDYRDGRPVTHEQEQESAQETEPKPRGVYRRLARFFGGYKWQVAVTLLMSLLGAGVGVLLPKVGTQALFNDILTEDQLRRVLVGDSALYGALARSLVLLVAAVLGIRLLTALFEMLRRAVMERITPRVTYDIKRKLFEALQRLSVGFYAGRHTGELLGSINDDAGSINHFFMDGVPFLLSNGLLFLGTLAMLFTIHWRLALLALALLPLILGAAVLADRAYENAYARQWAAQARLTSMVSDCVNGHRVIKAFGKEDEELARFAPHSEILAEAQLQAVRRESLLGPALGALTAILSGAVLALGGVYVVRGQMRVGDLLAFTVYLNMIGGPLQYFTNSFNWWKRGADAAARIFEIIDAQPDITEPEHPIVPNEIRGEIELRELDFEYEPARPVIKRVHLTIRAGEMLGIVGKTGAGKTTIANLISRLYDPKAGAVFIDGIDVRDLPLSLLRRSIGLVSQEIFLFSGTIAENIAYADPGAPKEAVIAAAKAAAAHDFILRLPDAYQTRVGAGGQELSGGERQRISIARAILQNPKILVLDEATAAMDTATERSIQAALSRLLEGRTTIAIAHRLSTLRDASRLCVIENGAVTEYGSFQELLQRRGAFWRLYTIQSEALESTLSYVGEE